MLPPGYRYTLYRTEHRDILNQCLTWNDEGFNSFCDALNVPIGFAILAQHIHQKEHMAKVAAALKSAPKQAFVKGLIGRLQEKDDLESQTLYPQVKLFWYRTARALYASNTSILGADPIVELLESEGKKKIGGSRNLAVFGDMIHAVELEDIRSMDEYCFPEFGSTGDGTMNKGQYGQ